MVGLGNTRIVWNEDAIRICGQWRGKAGAAVAKPQDIPGAAVWFLFRTIASGKRGKRP